MTILSTQRHKHVDILNYRLKNNSYPHRLLSEKKQACQIYVCQLIKVERRKEKRNTDEGGDKEKTEQFCL